jgi:hypothetical protein
VPFGSAVRGGWGRSGIGCGGRQVEAWAIHTIQTIQIDGLKGLLAWTGEWWATSRETHARMGSIRRTTKTEARENRRLRSSEGKTQRRQATLVLLISSNRIQHVACIGV